jgi:hypothetical protein
MDGYRSNLEAGKGGPPSLVWLCPKAIPVPFNAYVELQFSDAFSPVH